MATRAYLKDTVANRSEHDAVVCLVERILAAKRADAAADVRGWEQEIDARVYRRLLAKAFGATA